MLQLYAMLFRSKARTTSVTARRPTRYATVSPGHRSVTGSGLAVHDADNLRTFRAQGPLSRLLLRSQRQELRCRRGPHTPYQLPICPSLKFPMGTTDAPLPPAEDRHFARLFCFTGRPRHIVGPWRIRSHHSRGCQRRRRTQYSVFNDPRLVPASRVFQDRSRAGTVRSPVR
jgi:hypothetical protein